MPITKLLQKGDKSSSCYQQAYFRRGQMVACLQASYKVYEYKMMHLPSNLCLVIDHFNFC